MVHKLSSDGSLRSAQLPGIGFPQQVCCCLCVHTALRAWGPAAPADASLGKADRATAMGSLHAGENPPTGSVSSVTLVMPPFPAVWGPLQISLPP